MIDTTHFHSPPPIALGDQLALDFLNSVAAPQGEVHDWIRSGPDLLAWLEAFSAITAQDAETVRSTWDHTTLDGVAKAAVAWREQLRSLVQRIAAEGLSAVKQEDRQAINRWLDADHSHTRLDEASGSAYEVVRHRIWRDPAQIMAPVALAAAEMIAAANWALIRKCENPACTIWFQDRTKGHRRRWCSQALCGNRFKVAAFRDRQKGRA